MKKELFTSLPFYNSSKLDEIENRTKQQLKAESKDYFSLSRPWYRRVFRVAFLPAVASYFQTDSTPWKVEVIRRKERIATNRQQWMENVADYIELISLKDDAHTDPAPSQPTTVPEQPVRIATPSLEPSAELELVMKSYNQLVPYLRAESQLLEAVSIYGHQYALWHYSDSGIPKPIEEKPMILPTVKHNLLAGKTLLNTIILFVIVGLGGAYEAAVFGSILGVLMGISGVLKWLAVGSVLIIAKYFSFALYGTVKSFVQSNNRIQWRTFIHSRIIQVLLLFLIVNTSVFGFLYFFANRDKAVEREITSIRKEIQAIETKRWMDPDGFGEKDQSRLNELEQKAQLKETQLEQQHPFLETLKGVAMTLSSGLVLLADSIVMIYLMLSLKSYVLSRKLSCIRKAVTKDTIVANQLIVRLKILHEKGFQIWSLIGQLQFITKLRSGGTPSNAIFDPESETQPEYPYPLQQK